MHRLKSVLAAIIVSIMLVASLDYAASAATGKPFLLGKINKAKKTTTLKTSKGAALKLVTKPGKPPLAVSRDALVKNFNADKLDGKSATQLGVRTRVEQFTLSGAAVGSREFVIPDVPAGEYLVSYTLWLYLGANVGGYCNVHSETDDEYTGYASAAGRPDGFFPLSGNTALELSTAQDVAFQCAFTAATNVSTYEEVKVAFTTIDTSSGVPLPRLTPKKAAKAPDA